MVEEIENPDLYKIDIKKGRKNDKVRDYFYKDKDNNKLCCNINNCEKIFSMNSSVTTLKNI